MSDKSTHLLQLWMRHLITQIEEEFTQKLIKNDIPTYEFLNPERFHYYRQILEIYSQKLCLELMMKNFHIYVKKML
jgi:hypothetical protein